MQRHDVFALTNSALNGFLFADVTSELNGTTLTMLSILSRSGKDPWAEAGSWARLPKAAARRCVADSIADMRIDGLTRGDIQQITARLVTLLPSGAVSPELAQPLPPLHAMRPWLMGVCLAAVIAALVLLSTNGSRIDGIFGSGPSATVAASAQVKPR